jgi:hypothetical protein
VTSPLLRAAIRQGSQGGGRFIDSPSWQKVIAGAHKTQRAFVEHPGIAIGEAGRGAGKSFGSAKRFHRPAANHPMGTSVFITQNVERSRDILLPALLHLDRQHGWGLREYRKANAIIWPNGYRVLFRGCKDRNECNKRRGTPWVVAGWDECDAIASNLLEYDIHECVEPRLDFRLPWFATGTPGVLETGYWHFLCSGKNPNYKVFHWDARENPHIKDPVAYFLKALRRLLRIDPMEDLYTALVRELCKRGEAPDGLEQATDFLLDAFNHLLPAKFLREYLGLWAKDIAQLCYILSPRNNFAGPPPLVIEQTTIALDLGGASIDEPDLDHCAWAVAQASRLTQKIYVREARKSSDMDPTRLGMQCLQLLERYAPDGGTVIVYVDSASAGKLIERHFRSMGIPVRAAIKGPKKQRILMVKGAIERGDVLFSYKETTDFRSEASVLVWNDKMTDHHEKCADDCSDALLYAVVPLLDEYEPEHEAPEPGTAEYERMIEAEEFEERYRQACAELDEMDV